MRIPRIRARSGQGDDGKFYFELSLWNFEGTEMIGGEPVGTYGPFETEKKCKEVMREVSQVAVKACVGPNGETPSGYLDLKNGGQFRSFNEH